MTMRNAGFLPTCLVCQKPKKPIGRDAPPGSGNDYCTLTCPGYAEDPRPGYDWPKEKGR